MTVLSASGQLQALPNSYLVKVRAPVEPGQVVVQVSKESDRQPVGLSGSQVFGQLDDQELPRVVVAEADDVDASVAVVDVDDDDRVFEDGHVFDVQRDVVRVGLHHVDGDVHEALKSSNEVEIHFFFFFHNLFPESSLISALMPQQMVLLGFLPTTLCRGVIRTHISRVASNRGL